MVLCDIMETVDAVYKFMVLLLPLVILVLTILVRRGILTKEQKETADDVIKVLTESVEVFKSEDKASSKSLTELIGVKSKGAKVGDALDAYLKKYGFNEKTDD